MVMCVTCDIHSLRPTRVAFLVVAFDTILVVEKIEKASPYTLQINEKLSFIVSNKNIPAAHYTDPSIQVSDN
jgi:hypothetical protein